MKNLIIGILFALVVILGAWLLFYNRVEAPADDIIPVPTSTSTTPTTTPNTAKDPSDQSGKGEINVTSPKPGQMVSSPLSLSGEARGNWFFEASAPVNVVDANGKIIGQKYIEAQGEWMTTNFVPFQGTITFSTPSTPNGWIVFMNDNPSGLPEHSRSISIPVVFSN